MVNAKLDDWELTASEALVLIWFNTVFANHVKLHAFANWGINVEPEQQKHNPFNYQNGVVTVMYNYFGYSSFPTFFDYWKRMGLLGEEWKPAVLLKVFNHGVQHNI